MSLDPKLSPKLSLIVVAKNEERLIGQCLASASFCDERIVVDSFSTDRTVELARENGARVIQREFAGYVEQKQFALDNAHGEWVLLLDADEQVTFESRKEIERVLASKPDADGYEIRRILFHLNHYFTGGLYREYRVRLFRRSLSRIAGRNPHDFVSVSGKIGRLNAPILHFSYRDISDHVTSINRLTTAAVDDAPASRLSAVRMLTHPAGRFLKIYFLRGGFREGGRGLYSAMAAAFYVFLKYAKIYERRLNAKRGD